MSGKRLMNPVHVGTLATTTAWFGHLYIGFLLTILPKNKERWCFVANSIGFSSNVFIVFPTGRTERRSEKPAVIESGEM